MALFQTRDLITSTLLAFTNQRRIQGGGGLAVRFEGVVTLLWGVFDIKNDIISYNISSSPIDHYKKTVAIPLLDSSIIQMQDRFSDEDCHARHLLCLVQSILINKALQLGRMK